MNPWSLLLWSSSDLCAGKVLWCWGCYCRTLSGYHCWLTGHHQRALESRTWHSNRFLSKSSPAFLSLVPFYPFQIHCYFFFFFLSYLYSIVSYLRNSNWNSADDYHLRHNICKRFIFIKNITKQNKLNRHLFISSNVNISNSQVLHWIHKPECHVCPKESKNH